MEPEDNTLTPEIIRNRFIEDNTDFMLDQLKKVLRGEEQFSCRSGIWLNWYWGIMEEMILNAKDKPPQDTK